MALLIRFGFESACASVTNASISEKQRSLFMTISSQPTYPHEDRYGSPRRHREIREVDRRSGPLDGIGRDGFENLQRRGQLDALDGLTGDLLEAKHVPAGSKLRGLESQ